MRRLFRSFGFPILLLSTASCAQMCAAEDVAMGVARLTTLNADALVNALNADETCGFSNINVQMAATRTGEVGKIGTLVLTVKDCELDLGTAGVETSRNCAGKATRAYGKATVSGTKTVTGYLTGSMLSPIIPEGPDSVVITLSATFDNFRAVKDGGAATMTWKNGGLSGSLSPRLAVAADSGACAINSGNTAFWDVSYKPTDVLLQTSSDELELQIQSSNLQGEDGVGPRGENTITGTVGLWDEEYTIPGEGIEGGLDPDYDAAKFLADHECTANLAKPVSYSCDMVPMLAQNAARGLVRLVGVATSMLENNNTCGFKAPTVLASATMTGTPPGPGSLSFSTSASPCAMALPAEMTLPPDCSGSSYVVSGSVTANTKKTVTGLLTGVADTPLVPLERTAVVYEHNSLVFDNFKVWEKTATSATEKVSVSFTGTITGKVKPVAGELLGQQTPAGGPLYAIATPVAAFEDIAAATGKLTLRSDGKTFVVDLDAVSIDAFNGSFGGKSNSIEASLTANGKVLAGVPDARLNPEFDQTAFNASYSCAPGLKEPVPAQ